MATESSPYLAHHFVSVKQQHDTATLGMWAFLVTEAMVFGGLFLVYTIYRLANPREFEAASERLNLWFGGINTVVLLTSSLTMVLAVHFSHAGRRRETTWALAATALLGTTFLVIKAFEYHGDYVENLMPGLRFDNSEWSAELREGHPLRPERVKLFLLIYYIMTGLHAVHLVIGIVWMSILAIMAWRAAFTPEYYYPVEVGGLYWHFVDVIWVFLLPLLYLVGVRH
jgi:cytochrome c oxidase subunit III